MEKECKEKMGKRMLLLGAYSMEVVECGGALLNNALHGGVSHAAIAFAGEQMQQDLKKSAEILKTSVEFLNMDAGNITASRDEKVALVKVIRQFAPEIIITQDTEHCVSDLDPGRRPFMTLVLEAIALAGRHFAMDELPGLKPSSGATIYYMTPEHPNCVIDIFDVWEQKCAAMDALHAQLLSFGKMRTDSPEHLARRKAMIPEWDTIDSDLERGRLVKRKMDETFYMYPSSTGHCRALFAEPYRREGYFVLKKLMK
jgi:Uncharacterized proteins, LmbE homologs